MGNPHPVPALQNLKPWKKGQTGNPGGVSRERRIALSVLREWCDERAAQRMIELAESHDDLRVASVMTKEIVDRIWGKPKERPETEDAKPLIDPAKLTDEQKRVLLEIFRTGAVKAGE
jgi:hypothetical protein